MFRLILFCMIVLMPASFAQQDEVRYSYDRNGRLTRVDYGNRRAISYTYDAAGNLIRRVMEVPQEGGGEVQSKKKESKKKAPGNKT